MGFLTRALIPFILVTVLIDFTWYPHCQHYLAGDAQPPWFLWHTILAAIANLLIIVPFLCSKGGRSGLMWLLRPWIVPGGIFLGGLYWFFCWLEQAGLK